MNKKKIVIAGANGFIGKYFINAYQEKGHEVTGITRNGEHNWDDLHGLIQILNGADMVINLAGKSVDCRYNDANRKAILNSRVHTTSLLGQAIKECQQPPRLWINSSTATIYRHAEDRPMTESDGEIGEGFSVSVATAWESTFFSVETPQTRKVALRMAIVFGKKGGALEKLIGLTRLGMGGHQGNGQQMVSWIHIDDLFKIVEYTIDNEEINGVVNCSSPQPVSNRYLMKALRKRMEIPLALHTPEWLLQLGALIIRTETELVLKSRWVLPERLQLAGFRFQFPTVEKAIKDLV